MKRRTLLELKCAAAMDQAVKDFEAKKPFRYPLGDPVRKKFPKVRFKAITRGGKQR